MRGVRCAVVSLCACLGLLGAAPAVAQSVQAVPLVTSGLESPLYAAAPRGDSRLFVVERRGRIRVVVNGVLQATPFLDIDAKVSPPDLGEGGLLGLAFPDDYATSGLFTVYYTDNNLDSVVSRFSVSADPNVADPTEQVLLFIDQTQPEGTYTNHKGGTIQYGPDGFLWFATGDGGGSNDPNENAQNPQSLLGKMLRIDVGPVFAPGSVPVAGQVYRIPADNPFVGSGPGNEPRDEIWALGLRNPYRWSFDRQTGDLWIGDVGQSAREELDFEPASDPGGRNYGWDVMEGTLCNPNDPAPGPCPDPSFTLPLLDYGRSQGDCTIVGGNVFRYGTAFPRGLYFFGDFCSGNVWSLDPATLEVVDRTSELGPVAGPNFALVAFGEDGLGRTLIVSRSAGVYRIAPVAQAPAGCGLGPELAPGLLGLMALRGARRRR